MEFFIGQLSVFAFGFTPRGWFACNGQLLSIADYQALFSLLGTTYGGDGRTTFQLPDLRGRSVVGQGNGPGLDNVTLGERGGVTDVTITQAQMPAHNHTVAVSTAAGEESAPSNNFIASHATAFNEDATAGAYLNGNTINTVGNGQPLNIRNPFLGMNYCICYNGVYPSRN